MPRPAAQPRRPRRRRTAARHPLDRLITGFVGAGTLLLLLPQALSHLPGQAQWDSLQRYGGVLLLLGLGLLALRLRRRPTETAPPRPEAPPSARDAALPARLLRTPPPRAPATSAPLPAAPATPPPAAASATEPVPPPRPTAWGPEVFRVIEWRRFEALVEVLFAQAGFTPRSQSHGADGGVDIWLHSRHQPDGAPVNIVQRRTSSVHGVLPPPP